MARPSQAITFPEVVLAKYGNRPRMNMPTEVGSPIDVDMGSDHYGWYRDAVKVANDRVKQIQSSKRMYERGERPYEKLHLRTNRGAITPFGVNSVGGEFVSPPERTSRGELRGGIMFTKAGQDYLQGLLNKRQKEYAEIYSTSSREVPTSTTDESAGEIALNAVYPLYDALLDDLRTFNVKSLSTFNNWWAMMLTTLPILGSNFRQQIKEITDTLAEIATPYQSYVLKELDEGSNAWKLGRGMVLRLEKAIWVMNQYIGSKDKSEVDDQDWDAHATYNGLLQSGRLPMVRGHPMSEASWLAMREDEQRNNLRHLLPQYAKAPIDAPAPVREELVRNLNKKAGVTISKATEDKVKDFIRRLFSEQQGGVEDASLRTGRDYEHLSEFPEPQGEQRIVMERRDELEPRDADGEFRPRTGRLEERPVQSAVASDVALGRGRPRKNAVGSGLATDLLSSGWNYLKSHPKDALVGLTKGLVAVDKAGKAFGYKGKGGKEKR